MDNRKVFEDREEASYSQRNGRSSRRNMGRTHNNNNLMKNDTQSSSSVHLPSESSQNGNKTKAYLPHLPLNECLIRYNETSAVSSGFMMIRGKLRVLPGNDKTTSSFVSCDRGLLARDVIVSDYVHRNRALDGDLVYVEVLPVEDQFNTNIETKTVNEYETELAEKLQGQAQINEDKDHFEIKADALKPVATWQDDEIQMDIWNPQVTIARQLKLPSLENAQTGKSFSQRTGHVVHVIPPNSILSEPLPDTKEKMRNQQAPSRRIVGSLVVLQRGTILLTPNNKSLPQFKCPHNKTEAIINRLRQEQLDGNGDDTDSTTDILDKTLFSAEYIYGSWQQSNMKWPPCINVEKMGKVGDIECEIEALLADYKVNHGDFSSEALKNVEDAVRSGVFYHPQTKELCWKPTPSMYEGRRDYRNHRIFTIDPTSAKDLDDALHCTELSDGTIEIGVHIADVSYFVQPDQAVDDEALRRATTVYLVDRTVPMLPRPLCEVACSLNEDVERLAFSCVWRMNSDGTLRQKVGTTIDKDAVDDVYYGRTVIKSCARLDYATAQNIIDNKVGMPDDTVENTDIALWPESRRPTGGHTLQEVAADVRMMHRVAMARRRLRYENGAIALDSVKLAFQLDVDGQTPLIAAPYPIRDSNRLVEEYMLLANYLVAQRLITHAKDKALLRRHPPPLMTSMSQVAAVAKAGMNFILDTSSSEMLQKSLVGLSQECHDPLLLKCMTQILTLPMQQAEYFAAGTEEPESWRHFALNMPYYTHFTSPIRRYADVLVHRLLQATIDGDNNNNNNNNNTVVPFPHEMKDIQLMCEHCSEKQKASKMAQQKCDRIFLSLYVQKHPFTSELGIVLSVGVKTFTVFIPNLGTDCLLYLDEHKDSVTWAGEELRDGSRRILIQQKTNDSNSFRWSTLDIRVFVKVKVSVVCKSTPPIDIKLRLEGPWE